MAQTSPELAGEISAWVAKALAISGQQATQQSMQLAASLKKMRQALIQSMTA
jgi:hypothetical protein